MDSISVQFARIANGRHNNSINKVGRGREKFMHFMYFINLVHVNDFSDSMYVRIHPK